MKVKGAWHTVKGRYQIGQPQNENHSTPQYYGEIQQFFQVFHGANSTMSETLRDKQALTAQQVCQIQG